MDTEKSHLDGIKEEIELARALTALLMAVKLHCSEHPAPHDEIPSNKPDFSSRN